MNDLKKLRKGVRKRAVDEGVVARVVKETGFTSSTVSRTLWGRFDRPNPIVVEALKRAIAELGISEETAA
jgi:hypothetical protein